MSESIGQGETPEPAVCMIDKRFVSETSRLVVIVQAVSLVLFWLLYFLGVVEYLVGTQEGDSITLNVMIVTTPVVVVFLTVAHLSARSAKKAVRRADRHASGLQVVMAGESPPSFERGPHSCQEKCFREVLGNCVQ